MKQLKFEGWIKVEDFVDAYDILVFYHDQLNCEPLARILEDKIVNENVTVRYFISDHEAALEQIQTEYLTQLMGCAEVEYWSHYSEYTGYLWTDEEITIGGHDLLRELKSYDGKYLILLIDVSNKGVLSNEFSSTKIRKD